MYNIGRSVTSDKGLNMRKANRNNVDLKNITKESLTEALFFLMDEKPYKNISIFDICLKAGVSRNAFYRNYPAKDAIIRRWFFEVTDKWRREIRNKYPITVLDVFTEIFKQYEARKQTVTKIIEAGLMYLQIDVIFKSLRDLASTSKYPDFALCHLAGSLTATVTYWLINKKPQTPEEMAHIVCKFNHFKEDSHIFLPEVSDIDYLMSLHDFAYEN